MKRPNFHISGIDEGEEFYVRGTEQIFEQVDRKKFPQTKERYIHTDTTRLNHQVFRARKETPHNMSQLKH